MTDEIKLPLIQSLNRKTAAAVADAFQLYGQALPCTVAVIVSSGIVTVNFEVNATPFTLPQVTVPLGTPEYIRYPIKVGDKGWVAPAAAHLGPITGQGGSIANLFTQPANLSALVFYWLGNVNWSAPEDPNAVIAYAPSGVNVRDTQSLSVTSTKPVGVSMATPAVSTTGNALVGSGCTGSFVTSSGQVVTVMDGLITNIF